MIKLVPFLAMLSVATAEYGNSGNWGLFKLMNRDTKCYSYDEGHNEMWTRNCNKLDNFQLWRYDDQTQQLQNKGMSDSRGEAYCAVVSGVGNRNPIRMAPCYNSDFSKFIFKKGSKNGVLAQAFAIKLDGGRCIDVDWWSESRDENIWTFSCEVIDRDRTDHWTVFEEVSQYQGGLLSSIGQDSFSDGNWGSLRINPALDVCYGIKVGDRLELEQQPCDTHDMGQKWRYDTVSRKISNYRFPLNARDLGCLTFSNNRYYMEICNGAMEQRFQLRDGTKAEGTFQQIVCERDTNECIDVDGWESKGWKRIHTWRCEDITVKNSDHWVKFDFFEAGVKCPAGTSRSGKKCEECPANTFSKAGAACTDCPSGTQSDAGATVCTDIPSCPAGTFVNGKFHNCISCPANTYSEIENSVACTDCPSGTQSDAGAAVCNDIPSCPAGTFVNGKFHNCISCPANTYSEIENSAACTNCPEGYEAKQSGSTTCTIKRTIIATAKTNELSCVVGKTKPPCLMQCRFRTSDGVTLSNAADVTFYKQVGLKWMGFKDSEYNDKYKWHNVEVADKPTGVEAGLYKCEITYDGMTASTQMRVSF